MNCYIILINHFFVLWKTETYHAKQFVEDRWQNSVEIIEKGYLYIKNKHL